MISDTIVLKNNLRILGTTLGKTPSQTSSQIPSSCIIVSGSTQDSLALAAIRGRHYNASNIRTAQNLRNKGGYNESVINFTSNKLKGFALEATPDTAKPTEC
jgi:hypothetical protein